MAKLFNTISSIFYLACSLVVLSSCGGSTDSFNLAGNTPPEATLASIQENVFTPSCAISGCHAGSSPAGLLNLEAGNSFSNTVSVASSVVENIFLVVPTEPDLSYLIQKLEGANTISGQQMPPPSGALDQSVIDIIRTWILDGALEQ